jgi:Mrp family chromosome partitioning ATPase
LVTITGDDPAVAATIATNVATAASYDARSVLLVDSELSADLVGSLLRVRGSRGLAEILSGSTDWTEAIASATIGRDRMLDVITSGRAGEPVGGYDPAPVRYHLARVARRYDLVVLVAPPAQVRRGADSILPAPDVIYCATLGRTPLHELGATVASLRGSGVRVHGVVLWDAGPPDIEGTSPMYDQADSGASLPISASHSADG